MNRDTLTVAEAAELLGIEQKLLRRRLRQGIVRGIKMGNIWLITRPELERFGECSESHTGFVSARGLLRKFGGSLSSEQVTLDKRKEAELGKAKLGRQSGHPKRVARPDLEKAAADLTQFYGNATLTARIAQLELRVSGKDVGLLGSYLTDQAITEETLKSAFTLKAVAGQINVVIHATGILLALPYLLEESELVQYVSLGAGNTGKEFDLRTDIRVAEFKFIQWRGGSEAIRQNNLFKDLFHLAEHEGPERRYLYLIGKEHPLRFLEGDRALNSVLSKNETLKKAFRERYGNRFSTVSEYYHSVSSRVEIHDLRDLVPFFSSF